VSNLRAFTGALKDRRRKICKASGIHVSSCPVRKTHREARLGGMSDPASSFGGRFNL